MMNQSDIQLIELFAKQGDQAAFEQLVDRYVDVAYSAAITCLRSDDLARDASQLTFVELARKATSLSEKVKLGGWVYTTSRNISRKIQRGELRRLKREQDYADQMKTQNSPEIDWAKLAPEIHEALERLKPADRDSIILRYFQHKSLAETGKALGLSADAARMRLNRALERLNKQLTRKGITSTAAALAAALPAHAAVTAPVGLAKSISIAALAKAGAATIGLSTLTGVGILSTKTVIISASVAATVLVGGTVYLKTQTDDTATPAPPVVASTTDASAMVEDASQLELTTPETPVSLNTEKSSAALKADAGNTIVGTASELADFDPSTVIDPKRLKEAEQMLDLLSLVMTMGGADGPVQVITGDILGGSTDELVKKLSLRLGLNPEQEQVFADILAENRASMTNGVDPQALLDGLIGMDRKKATEFLALGMMGDPSLMDDPNLAAYSESLNNDVAKELGVDVEALVGKEPAAPWNENEEVLAKLSEHLTPDQQTELVTYVEEQALREKERAAYGRSSQIANQLGLNEEDRNALYDYLYENPDATHQDIKDNLAPELHELLKEPDGLESLILTP